MKNIHVLPTDKSSKLFKHQLDEITLNISKHLLQRNYGFNIYITSDEEIKEGDYFIAYSVTIDKKPYISCASEYKERKKEKGKIILTTDQVLIKDGVQAIDEEFLEWFVKNPSCEEVEVIPYLEDIINPLTNEKFPAVQHRHFDETKMIFKYHYKIINPKTTQEIIDEDFSGGLDLGQIIPKEEPKFEESTDTTVDIMLLANSMFGKKEETIEEVAFRLYPIDMRECDNSEDWDINEQYRNEWIAGAKWMKEQYRIKDLRK